MQSFLVQIFNWSRARADVYIGGSTDADVIDRLSDPTNIPSDVSIHLYRRVEHRIQQKRNEIRLRGWATTPRRTEVLAQLSLFELETVINTNPFYLLYAFGLPLLDCHALMAHVNLVLDQQVAAHAALVSLLMKNGSMFVDAAHNELGLVVATRLDKVSPFPPGHFATHPLRDDDPDIVPAAFLKQKLVGNTDIITRIRERRFMSNRVVVIDGMYKIKTRSVLFAEEVLKVRERAKKLEPRIRKAYKKLKKNAD